jgi:hypothetical protein
MVIMLMCNTPPQLQTLVYVFYLEPNRKFESISLLRRVTPVLATYFAADGTAFAASASGS